MSTKILIIGACGQIGTDLQNYAQFTERNVIASDIRKLNVV
jgi:dTDP-4-dehydrorhamnose reductase